MHAELKRLHSPDVPDLKNYSPEQPDIFGFLLQLIIGPADQAGEESFDVIVCTPEWLKQRYANRIVLGENHLIVPRFDYAQIEKFVSDFIKRCNGQTWNEIAQKLCRLGKWEFEDYSDVPSFSQSQIQADGKENLE